MSQIILHRQDNESEKDQIATTTLDLKSIVGREKTEFNSITGIENNLEYVQELTLNNVKQLTIAINNLTKAVDLLIGIETSLYKLDAAHNAELSNISNCPRTY